MERLKELRERERLAELGGGKERLEKHRSSGRMSARERINALLDPGSFFEIDKFVTHRSSKFGLEGKKFLGDGVVTGKGTIDGRNVFVFSQDATVFGGSLATYHAKKIVKIMELAERTGAPVIGINDSGGARIQEGVESLGGYADIFLKNVLCSGVIPQISLIMGACAGGAVYSPAITDFIIMVDKTSHMFITGPEVIKTVTKETVSKEELGGAHSHNSLSGVAHFQASDEADCLHICRQLLSYLPSNNLDSAPAVECSDPSDRTEAQLNSLIPAESNQPYDIKEVIRAVADNGEYFETQADFAENIVTAFIRLAGQSIAVVANQPQVLAGCLDINASVKAARFVRFCDAFNIPLLTLVDVPGFLPGVSQEHGGIIKHGAKLLYAFAEATVPKVTLITRKAYGGAYDVMSSKHLRGDINLAYPSAEIAVMGAEGAVNIVFKRELELAREKGDPEEARRKLIEDYKQTFLSPWEASELGFIDAVIEPALSRQKLIESFAMLHGKRQSNPRKKHGNIPL